MAGNLKKNFLYNAAYQILVIILPLITTPYVSRVLGAENIGVYSYTHSVANYFVLIGMLGVRNYGNREIARVRDDNKKLSETFSDIFALQLFMSLLMIVLYVAYVLLFVDANRDIALIQSLFVATAATDITWFFFGMEEFKSTVVRNTIVRLVSLLLIFTMVRSADDLAVYTLILTGSLLAGYIVLIPFAGKFIRPVMPKWRNVRRHIVPNLRLFIPVIAVSIFNVMSRIMLGAQSTMVQVGLYENTDKLMRIPFSIITAMGTVMMPYMSHMVSAVNTENYNKVVEKSIVFAMCLASALAGGLAGVGRSFAPLFFGEEFVECGTLLMWISPTILFLSWANVIRMQYLIPKKMDTEFTVSTFIGAGVNILVNYLLIPRIGALGAVIGTFCAEGSLTVYQTLVVRGRLPIGRFIQITAPFVAMGILMSVCVMYIGVIMNGGILTLLLQVAAGIVIYLVLAGLYMWKSKEPVVHEIWDQALEVICKGLHIRYRSR